MSGLYKNTTQEIELHSNALQASLDGLKRLARAIELKRSNMITLAHGMSAPSLDELWTKFRQVQRAAKGMAKRSMLLQQEVVSFENQSALELKGSVGEGPNQTNFSDQSSVRILAKFRNFQFSIEN